MIKKKITLDLPGVFLPQLSPQMATHRTLRKAANPFVGSLTPVARWKREVNEDEYDERILRGLGLG